MSRSFLPHFFFKQHGTKRRKAESSTVLGVSSLPCLVAFHQKEPFFELPGSFFRGRPHTHTLIIILAATGSLWTRLCLSELRRRCASIDRQEKSEPNDDGKTCLLLTTKVLSYVFFLLIDCAKPPSAPFSFFLSLCLRSELKVFLLDLESQNCRKPKLIRFTSLRQTHEKFVSFFQSLHFLQKMSLERNERETGTKALPRGERREERKEKRRKEKSPPSPQYVKTHRERRRMSEHMQRFIHTDIHIQSISAL